MKYFLQREGRSFGPYSFDDLKRYQSEGRIGPEDKIRAEDSENWVLQTEFFNPPAAPAPQMSPAPVFTPPAPTPAPDPTPTPAPNPFAAPTDANPVWTPPAPAPQSNPFAPSGGTSANPFSAPTSGGFGAPPAPQGFGAPPANSGFGGPPASPGFGAPAGPGGFQRNPPNANIGQSGSYDAPPPSMGPEPPHLAWIFVLLLGVLTCGLFSFGWLLYQASFVRKLDAASKALALLLGSVGMYFAGFIGSFGIAVVAPNSSIGALIGGLCSLGSMALYFVAVFDMRKSLLNYYNTTEPLSLRLSGVMTFFFAVLYFQFHLDRIYHWKRTGRLR